MTVATESLQRQDGGAGSTAIFPGSFDPVTSGHLATIDSALRSVDKLIVAIGHNPEKPSGEFSIEERIRLLQLATQGYGDRVEIAHFGGSQVNFAIERGVHTIIRGLRNGIDLLKENELAFANRLLGDALGHPLETQFVSPPAETQQVSSSLVRQLLKLSDIPNEKLSIVLHQVLPEAVADEIMRIRRG